VFQVLQVLLVNLLKELDVTDVFGQDESQQAHQGYPNAILISQWKSIVNKEKGHWLILNT
jgi:hypothetical protein